MLPTSHVVEPALQVTGPRPLLGDATVVQGVRLLGEDVELRVPIQVLQKGVIRTGRVISLLLRDYCLVAGGGGGRGRGGSSGDLGGGRRFEGGRICARGAGALRDVVLVASSPLSCWTSGRGRPLPLGQDYSVGEKRRGGPGGGGGVGLGRSRSLGPRLVRISRRADPNSNGRIGGLVRRGRGPLSVVPRFFLSRRGGRPSRVLVELMIEVEGGLGDEDVQLPARSTSGGRFEAPVSRTQSHLRWQHLEICQALISCVCVSQWVCETTIENNVIIYHPDRISLDLRARLRR